MKYIIEHAQLKQLEPCRRPGEAEKWETRKQLRDTGFFLELKSVWSRESSLYDGISRVAVLLSLTFRCGMGVATQSMCVLYTAKLHAAKMQDETFGKRHQIGQEEIAYKSSFEASQFLTPPHCTNIAASRHPRLLGVFDPLPEKPTQAVQMLIFQPSSLQIQFYSREGIFNHSGHIHSTRSKRPWDIIVCIGILIPSS